MEKELLALKNIIKNGVIGGAIFSISQLAFDYADDGSMSLIKFILNFIVFGFFTAIIFSYKRKKNN